MKMMKLLFGIFLLVANAVAASPSDSRQPRSEVIAPVHSYLLATGLELGEVFGYESVEAEVVLSNAQDKAVNLVRVVPRLTEDKVIQFKPVSLSKGETTPVRISIAVGPAVGRFAHYFDVYQESADEPLDSFSVRGFADWIIDPASTREEFGNIDVDTGITRTVTIALRPGTELKLTKVIENDPRFDAMISVDGQSLQIKSRADAPLGLFDSRILVATNHQDQKTVGFTLQGQVVGGIIPDSNPVEIGLLRVGQGGERLVRLTQIDGKAIRIGGVRTEGALVDAELKECIPIEASCKLLRVSMPPQKERGQVGGNVYLDLPEYDRALPIRFGAIVIGKDTQIRNLNDDLNAAAEASQPVSSILKSAVQTPVPPREMSDPPGNGPLMKWQAAYEYNVYGYEIYRATEEKGKYTRINKKIVPVLDESGKTGSIYRWRDDSAIPGQTYWYYIGLVKSNGMKSSLSSPQKITAR